MQKIFLLAISNMRKNKIQSAIMVAVLLIAAIFMMTGLILIFDYQQNFDRRAEISASEDVVFSYQTRDEGLRENWRSIIESDSRTQRYSESETLCHALTYLYRDGDMNTHTVLLNIDEAMQRDLGKFNLVEESGERQGDAIYLPYIMKTGGGYRLGDGFSLIVKAVEYKYTVSGFYENTMIGSFNGGITSFLLAPDAYDKLQEDAGIEGVLFSVKLHGRADNEAFFNEVESKLDATANGLVIMRVFGGAWHGLFSGIFCGGKAEKDTAYCRTQAGDSYPQLQAQSVAA